MLILGSLAVRSLVGEEEGNGKGGGALDTPLGVAHLDVELDLFIREDSNDLSYSESSYPSVGSDLPICIEVGRVHGGLGSLVYGLYVVKSRRAL